MRIFKSKWFARFARKNGLGDAALQTAAAEIEAGNFDADLGGHVYKQRIARDGQGKRGGYRTIVLFKRGERAFFVYGFAKNERDNIADSMLTDYKDTARYFVNATEEQINTLLSGGSVMEVFREAHNEKI
jgi:hypothetical protein